LSYRYTKLENPMGEGKKDTLRVNPGAPGLKLEFHASESHQRRRLVSIQRD